MMAGPPGGGVLRRLARRLRVRSARAIPILLYHRVEEAATDPWALSVTPCHFAEQLEVLRRHARPVRLHEVPAALAAGRVPRRAVVVTFDDGYADNLHRAKPALERQEVPATVFLTSGFIGDAGEFWWDTLERLVLQPGSLPHQLALPGSGGFRWKLGDAALYAEDEARRHRRWRAWEPPPSGRHALHQALWEWLRPLTASEQRGAVAALRSWAGDPDLAPPARPGLSPAGATALSAGGLIDIGAHTVTHPALAALPRSAQREEIRRSKADLEEILDRAVTSFAYPYGRRCDYTAETVALVREAGFTHACANFAGVAGPASDPFQLPRLQVGDWDGEEFARWLLRHVDA